MFVGLRMLILQGIAKLQAVNVISIMEAQLLLIVVLFVVITELLIVDYVISVISIFKKG